MGFSVIGRVSLCLVGAAIAIANSANVALAESGTMQHQSPITCQLQNPKVRPGLINWHKSFQDACLASKSSGKPVLLFPMLGRLDQEFC